MSGASLNWKKNFSKKSVEQSRVFGAFWEILKNLHIYTTYDGVWQSVLVRVSVHVIVIGIDIARVSLVLLWFLLLLLVLRL